jgi:hypothetical protein
MHDFSWTTQLEYFTDIFRILNGLNFALKGKAVTVLNMQDKVKASLYEDDEAADLATDNLTLSQLLLIY